jgi:hypothetical protein
LIQIDTDAIAMFADEFADLAPQIRDAIDEGLAEIAERLVTEIAAIAPGRLGTDIQFQQLGEGVYDIGYNDPETEMIATFINYGTAPHLITPAFAQVLHFITPEGEEVFTREVMHPGIAPRYFLEAARMAIEGETESIMEAKLTAIPDVES